MSDDWIADVLLVVPAELHATAAQLYASATGRVEDAGPETFSVRLCALDGGAGVTHYACRTRIRRATLAALGQLAGALPAALWYVAAHDEDTDELRAARLDVDAWLATQGLARWRDPEEGEDD